MTETYFIVRDMELDTLGKPIFSDQEIKEVLLFLTQSSDCLSAKKRFHPRTMNHSIDITIEYT